MIRPKRTIIILEHDRTFLRLLTSSLRRKNYTIYRTSSDQRARVLIRRYKPDLVVLDMSTPNRGSLDLLARLRANPSTANVPVIGLTSRASKSFAATIPTSFVKSDITLNELSEAVKFHLD